MSLRSRSATELAVLAVVAALALQVLFYGFFDLVLEPRIYVTLVTWAVVGAVAVTAVAGRGRFGVGAAVGSVVLALVVLVPIVGFAHSEMARISDLLDLWPGLARTFLGLYVPILVGLPLGAAHSRLTRLLLIAVALLGVALLLTESLLRLGEPSVDPGIASLTPLDVVRTYALRAVTTLPLAAPLVVVGRRLRDGVVRVSSNDPASGAPAE